jgi:hypothetical protein
MMTIDATDPEFFGNSCDRLQRQPVRKIKPTRRSVSGKYPFRGKKQIPYESTLERDFVIRQQFFIDVEDVVAQPCSVPFQAPSGRSYVATPDFLVLRRATGGDPTHERRSLLVEVKPEEEWRQHWRTWLPKWKAIYRYAQSQGWEFHIADESRIRDVVLRNITFLDLYKRMSFESQESQSIVQAVRNAMSLSVGTLLDSLCSKGDRRRMTAHVWHLVSMRVLNCDVRSTLSEQTEVWETCHG